MYRRLNCLRESLVAAFTVIPSRNKSGSYTASKQAKILKKLVSGKTKNKGFWFRERDPKPIAPRSVTLRESKGASRRVVVLNKLFMKYVTDIMATGEISDVILGHGIEITRVKMSTDFQMLCVYWMATDSKGSDESLEEKLKRAAGPLRHELSQLKLMGEVPRISFVKDKHYSQLSEVDRLLAIADYGEDYVPLLPGTVRNRMFTPQFRTTSVGDDDDESTLPPMRHDVLALDHAAIMNRIVSSASKAKSAHDGYIHRDPLAPSEIGYVTENMVDRANEQIKIDDEMLREFLKKRKIERKEKIQRNVDARELRDDDEDETDDEFDESSHDYYGDSNYKVKDDYK